jgi:hypothetical protein
MKLSTIDVLVTVRPDAVKRFEEGLAKDSQLHLTMLSSVEAATQHLNENGHDTHVLVIDNALGGVFDLIKDLRQKYPTLLIIMVDEDADFGMPGRADDVTTEPFSNDDLLKKIKRASEERRLETLRADALPPVKNFAKALRKATKGVGKQQAAVSAVKELGYDYVAFFTVSPTEPPSLSMGAQVGPQAITALMPPRSDYNNVLGWVAQNGKTKIVVKGDQPSHFLIEKSKFGEAVCVPVGSSLRFGVMFACREQSGSIKQDSVVMVELICAQLASSLAKDLRG